MAATLLDSLSGLITPNVLQSAAPSFGESTDGLARGVEAAFPSLLAGLIGKSGNPNAMDQLFGLVTSPMNDGSALADVGGLLSKVAGGAATSATDLGNRFVHTLFGGQLGGITDGVARFAGIKPSSASTILAFAGPLVLGVLGRTVRSQGLNASGLAAFLSSQRSSVQNAVPAGLRGLFGLGAVPAIERERRGLPRWVLPAAILLLGLLGWLLLRPKAPAIREAAVSTTETVTDAARSAGAALTNLTLPAGRVLTVAPNGIEGKLMAFVQDPTKPVDQTTWFDFDRLLFETGSATLKPESQAQLDNVAAIFAAFPNMKAKVGGYTDNVGDPAANLKLSQDRATTVRAELIRLGVAADRLEAEGYGQQHPVADNSTEEGRAQNRRISLRVTAK